VLDAKGAAQQFANRLSHVKRESQPLRLAALAASGLPAAVAPSLTRSALPHAPCAGRPRPTNLDSVAMSEASEETRVRIDAIRPDAVAEGDQLAPIVEEEPGAEDDEYIN